MTREDFRTTAVFLEYQSVNKLVGTTISFMIFWNFSIFYQIFLQPQVKWWAIITYKHAIYDLPHEFPNNLKYQESV